MFEVTKSTYNIEYACPYRLKPLLGVFAGQHDHLYEDVEIR